MENNLLSCSQSGFRSLHSTMSSPQATNNWSYNVALGKVNAVVFLRFKESFDIVDHEILLSKLNAYTVSGFGVCEQLG